MRIVAPVTIFTVVRVKQANAFSFLLSEDQTAVEDSVIRTCAFFAARRKERSEGDIPLMDIFVFFTTAHVSCKAEGSRDVPLVWCYPGV